MGTLFKSKLWKTVKKSIRLRFMLEDLQNLRKNKWVSVKH